MKINGIPIISTFNLEKTDQIIEPCRDKNGNIFIPFTYNDDTYYFRIPPFEKLPIVEPEEAKADNEVFYLWEEDGFNYD